VNRWETPIGSFDLEVGEDGVSKVVMAGEDAVPPVDPALGEALTEHLHGRAGALRLDLQGESPLAQMTLAKLLEIPFGEVRPYAWVAQQIGRPTATRSVATAVAGNPVPLLIPCHRVVRSDGYMGEFSLGGADLKRKILEFESVDIAALEALARRNVRYIVDADEGVAHLPSCRSAPVDGDKARQELRSIKLWDGEPLRACPRCHPPLEE